MENRERIKAKSGNAFFIVVLLSLLQTTLLFGQQQDPNQMPLLPVSEIKDSLLIGLYHGPSHYMQTAEDAEFRAKEMNEAGFNFYASALSEKVILDACYKHGISMAPYIPETYTGLEFDTTKLVSWLDNHKDHPAIYGYDIMDEPWDDAMFATIEGIRRFIDPQLPNGKFTYCNLGAWDFDYDKVIYAPERYDLYARTVNSKVISFDTYPLRVAGKGFPCQDSYRLKQYYRNVGGIRLAGSKYDKKLWGCVQASGCKILGVEDERDFENLRTPNYNELLWSINSMLVFGFEGLHYYHYASYYPNDPYHFNHLINSDGSRSEHYLWAQQINPGIRRMGDMMTAFRYKGMISINDMFKVHKWIPDEIKLTSFAPLREIRTDGNIIVGCFERQGLKAVYLFNDDMYYPAEVSLSLEQTTRFEVWNYKNGMEQKSNAPTLSLDLEPGEGKWIMMEPGTTSAREESLPDNYLLKSNGNHHTIAFNTNEKRVLELYTMSGVKMLSAETENSNYQFTTPTGGVYTLRIVVNEKKYSTKILSQ